MTDKMKLFISLRGQEPIALLRSLSVLKPFSKRKPTLIVVDGFNRHEGSLDWIDKWIPVCQHQVSAYWGNAYQGEYEEGFLHFHRYYRDNRQIVKLRISDYPRSASAVLQMLAPLPWEIAVFASIHISWYDQESKNYYLAPGFSDFHLPHGWGCAFKGEGHNRLVSRRWLEFGPWHLMHGANDTTLVQFHDLEVDAATALEQGKVGHQRMGIAPIGGFIQSKFVYRNNIKGIYEAETRLLKIIAIDRKISQLEMLDYSAVRHYQALGTQKPIDNICYVFMIEQEGRENLHELWLRGFEVRAFVNHLETRLDTDYHPSPQKPNWVK